MRVGPVVLVGRGVFVGSGVFVAVGATFVAVALGALVGVAGAADVEQASDRTRQTQTATKTFDIACFDFIRPPLSFHEKHIGFYFRD